MTQEVELGFEQGLLLPSSFKAEFKNQELEADKCIPGDNLILFKNIVASNHRGRHLCGEEGRSEEGWPSRPLLDCLLHNPETWNALGMKISLEPKKRNNLILRLQGSSLLKGQRK